MGRVFKRMLKIAAIIIGVGVIIISARYVQVQNSIRNLPSEISEYSSSGFTPKGVYGHGDLITKNGHYSWYVYDIADPEYGVKKVCVFNIEPEDSWDIDFIYVKEDWYKLRSGTGIISDAGFTSNPEVQKWKNVVPTKLAFPVRRPDIPYRLKIFISKITGATLSPLEYLQGLKATNPSCANIPTP